MEYRLTGKSGLQISRVGFGCMSLAGDAANNCRLLQAAADRGINFFDTADLYDHGKNEILLGRAFREKRKDILIATKVGNQWKEDGSGWTWNPRKSYILEAADASLQRLQTDYIDLYQLHGGTLEDNIDETIEAFEQLQQQGKIRYYGLSSIRPNVIRAYASRSNISTVMMQYSLLDRRPEETCLELLADRQCGVLARGSLASGLLTGKPAKDYLQYTAAQVKKAADAVAALSGATHSPATAALQFVLRHPAISSAVVGIRTMQQLEEAIAAESAAPPDAKEYLQLQHILPLNYYQQHR